MLETETERENGIKKTFFRDYSPPYLAPHPFRPWVDRWRWRVMKGQADERREGWRMTR